MASPTNHETCLFYPSGKLPRFPHVNQKVWEVWTVVSKQDVITKFYK